MKSCLNGTEKQLENLCIAILGLTWTATSLRQCGSPSLCMPSLHISP